MLAWIERGLLPDPVVRLGIRSVLRQRLRQERRETLGRVVEAMRESPIAVSVDRANDQHYELPARFFREILGPRLKYSCCLWAPETSDLGAAEERMLETTCRRAGLRDGMRVLDLGCGWGSLAIWVGERYPGSHVVAVSNSTSQADFIREECRRRGVSNVEPVTADLNGFDPGCRFDRVLSIEMFEHMRNYERLLDRIADWLEPEGTLFVHLFCHRELAYFYEIEGRSDWMARHFFTGGMMPSEDLLARFDRRLRIERQWRIDGRHYRRTLLAWLARLDARREAVLATFVKVCGDAGARRWFGRWRLFLLASAELFGYREGSEWYVAHYSLARRSRAAASCSDSSVCEGLPPLAE